MAKPTFRQIAEGKPSKPLTGAGIHEKQAAAAKKDNPVGRKATDELHRNQVLIQGHWVKPTPATRMLKAKAVGKQRAPKKK